MTDLSSSSAAAAPQAPIAWADAERERAFARWLDVVAPRHALERASLRLASAGNGGGHPFGAGAKIHRIGDEQWSGVTLPAVAGGALCHDVAFLDGHGRNARHMTVSANRFEVTADIHLTPRRQSIAEPQGNDG